MNREACYRDHLPAGVASRYVDDVNGLRMHYLEIGEGPVLLLLHGFPELAFSWRKLMPALAGAGFRVIAPDQRGYGLTTGWEADVSDRVERFRMLNLVTDMVALLHRLGIGSVHAVIGHDFGSPVAGFCALLRPDRFSRLVCMSAPFSGAPLPGSCQGGEAAPHRLLDQALAQLEPPRMHYQWYFSGTIAQSDMLNAPGGLKQFLGAYYHAKSGPGCARLPEPMPDLTPGSFARLPEYYVMQRDRTMPETVAPYADVARTALSAWMSEADLEVYAELFRSTGFQGGLNWYRCVTEPEFLKDLEVFGGARLRVPAAFVAGRADWGIHQTPGALEAMRELAGARYKGEVLIDGAGHWVQQERPEETFAALMDLLDG